MMAWQLARRSAAAASSAEKRRADARSFRTWARRQEGVKSIDLSLLGLGTRNKKKPWGVSPPKGDAVGINLKTESAHAHLWGANQPWRW
jgi:hypothetical protein